LSEIAIAWLRARAARSRKAAANTDLDVELARRGIDKTIGVAIMRTPESNPPLGPGMELGQHVTLVEEAKAAFSYEGMRAVRRGGRRFCTSVGRR